MKKFSLIFTIIFSLFIGACEDILNQEPLANPTVGSFYTNELEATLAVNAVYDMLGSTLMYKRGVIALSMMEDHMYKATPPADGPGYSEINEFNIDPTNPIILDWYTGLYIGIDRANIALEKIPLIPDVELDPVRRSRLIAEAKFLRGLYYFNLVKLFGEVPIILSSASNTNTPGVAKSTEADVWAQVETDFNDALPDLPEQYSGNDIGRATSGAAKTFLAKAHMWQNEHDQALPLLEEVINSNIYELSDNYVDLFVEGVDTNEEIFVVGFNNNGTGSFSNVNENSLWQRYIGVRGTGNQINAPSGLPGFGFLMATDNITDRYEPNDERRYVNLWEPGKVSPATGNTFNPVATGTLGRYPTDIGVMKWWWNNQGWNGDTGIDLSLTRYADVLLLHAEVVNEISGPVTAAYNSINLVRDRAGVDDLPLGLNQDEFFDAVLDERANEFEFEFQRWWDLSRTKTAEEAFVGAEGKAAFDPQKHYKWPIPQQAIQRNTSLEQNSFYK